MDYKTERKLADLLLKEADKLERACQRASSEVDLVGISSAGLVIRILGKALKEAPEDEVENE